MCYFIDDEHPPSIHILHDYSPTTFIATISGTVYVPKISLHFINGSKSFTVNLAPKHLRTITEVITDLNQHMDIIQHRKNLGETKGRAHWCQHTTVAKA